MAEHIPTDEQVCKLALLMTQGVGNVLFKQLISYCGSARQVFLVPKGKLGRIPGVGEKLIGQLSHPNLFEQAATELARLQAFSARILFYSDADYPERLRHIPDAPVALFYKGTANLNAPKVVAIVGTRRNSDYGAEVTGQLIADLSRLPDLLVVSGLAYGIDAAAHQACLRAALPTVGVMANGLDTVYPSVHKKMATQMMEQGGGLLSENLLGTKPSAPLFPARNRIVAGMADAVVVTEAGDTGGALITARLANDYNREVFAVPGRVTHKTSAGCHWLIRTNQAHLLSSAADLVEMMGWSADSAKAIDKKPSSSLLDALSPEEKLVCELLLPAPLHIDELTVRSLLPAGTLASALLSLEFGGLVRAMPGKIYAFSLKQS